MCDGHVIIAHETFTWVYMSLGAQSWWFSWTWGRKR